MQRQWRFVNTGRSSAASNMAIDEAMLLTHEAGVSPPTLRVYSWEVPTLSLGYAQKTSREVNLAACQQHGVALVRRPTGGRAVLHDQEVTYSVVLPTALAHGHNTLTEHYRLIGAALVAALQRLGVPVHLERLQRRSHPRREIPSSACFAALARYELSVNGKKIVGSAQKRLQRSLLQHGAVPLWMDRQRLLQCLHVPSERLGTLVQEAYAAMTAVNENTATPVCADALQEALREAFAASFEIELVAGPLLPEERRLARELQTSKYDTPRWNLEGAAAWRQQNRSGPPE